MATSDQEPRSGAKAGYREVARDLRTQIEAGRLRHGDVLPSTRELAESWGVSVFTIQEAMKVLAEEGLVVGKSRSKRVVNAPASAQKLGWRPDRPQVVLVGGYPGSGKSELSRILARHTGWPMIDKDTITRPVVEAALEIMGHSPHDRESDEYVTRIRPMEYEALRAATLENVECGNSAVVAAPFVREFGDAAWLDRTRAAFEQQGADLVLVWVYCDGDSMHRYMRQRGAARDATKLADWPAWLASLDLDFRPAAEHLVVDNSESSAPLQAQAVALIDQVLSGQE
ncbi:GntR family transcriptional regulator [Spongisporangium articulatum]|uniref:GntR family transcriptional regulator n=1 Tax=Spongisporangium articulatum TaxID=3362603 RepID=A0ABW8AIR7_9ACTN